MVATENFTNLISISLFLRKVNIRFENLLSKTEKKEIRIVFMKMWSKLFSAIFYLEYLSASTSCLCNTLSFACSLQQTF